jgi:hypothetical protein
MLEILYTKVSNGISGKAADIFSLGVVFFVIYMGSHPFDRTDENL